MSNFNNHGTIEISKAVIGCIGVILAALIGGIFLLISVGVIQIGRPSSTASADQQTVSSSPQISYPTPLPANSISENVVNQLNFGQVTIEDVNNCLNKAHEGARPFVSFRTGDQIPSNALVATDYGGGGRSWSEYPVTPLCHNGSWGLFRSRESYIAPYEGAYWIIIQ